MKTATISSSGSPSPSSSSVSSSSSSSSSSSPSHLHQRCAVRAEDRTGKQRLENGEDQMQACFVRLMQIVPTIPPTTGKMSKVQLLQHVIDYILDLEYTLDLRPTTTTTTTTGTEGKAQGAEGKARDGGGASEASASPPPQPPMTAWSAAPQLMTAPVDRRPLTENAQTNNGGRHQTSHFERGPSITWS